VTSASLIRDTREKAGLSQSDLARRSGIPRTAISAYEHARRVPTTDIMLRLAEACGAHLEARPRPRVDLTRNGGALEQVLDLAEHLPTRRRTRLTFPPLPT